MAPRGVEARHPDRAERAREIADRTGAVLSDGPVAEDEHRIVLFEDREELWDATSRRHGLPLSFRSIDLRIGSGNLSRKQPIARAIGPKSRTIVDLTAGFGHDACLLACMGWSVTAIERDPFIATMLALSLEDTSRDPGFAEVLNDHLTVHHGEAMDWLVSPSEAPDVIFLDPMYEPGRGSAKPRKRAQVLQALVGASSDALEVLDAARGVAHRIVVKRPSDGQPLAEAPDLVFAGRQVRYDVYITP